MLMMIVRGKGKEKMKTNKIIIIIDGTNPMFVTAIIITITIITIIIIIIATMIIIIIVIIIILSPEKIINILARSGV
jgi:hypothetical protein